MDIAVNGWDKKLLDGWQIVSPLWYVVYVVVASLTVRLAISALKSLEPPPLDLPQSIVSRTMHYFLGRNRKMSTGDSTKGDSDHWESDYWYPFIIGVIEFATYPILMVVGAWVVIGAWFGFKTLAQWEHWKQVRATFNRFLIGNALVLLLSFSIVRWAHLIIING